jgi:threonine dehydratase
MNTVAHIPRALRVPEFADVLAASKRIQPYLSRTPLYTYPSLNASTGLQLWVKHENHLPIGSFKVRGGVNLISQLSPAEREAGVIAASTGNHGQSVAYAANLFGVQATICVPENANPVKVDSMRHLRAQLVVYGRDFDEAREYCERLSEERGFRYIHSGNEPLLIAGVGTASLEIFVEYPRVDTILVPVGGGSGAAAACIVAKALRPETRVIGVQSEAAPAAQWSWRARALREAGMETFAEGLATRTAFELPQRIMWELLDDFVLVSEQELRESMMTMIEKTRNLVEGAGAAALAGALKLREQLQGKQIVIICSGGNVSLAQLHELQS